MKQYWYLVFVGILVLFTLITGCDDHRELFREIRTLTRDLKAQKAENERMRAIPECAKALSRSEGSENEEECTLERAIAKNKRMYDHLLELNQEHVSEYEAVLALLKTPSVFNVPSDLPKLPEGSLQVEKVEYVFDTDTSRGCVLDYDQRVTDSYTHEYNGNWDILASRVVGNFNAADETDGGSQYEFQVLTINSCFIPHASDELCESLRGVLKWIVKDEARLRLLGEWGIKLASEKLNGAGKSKARQWLRDFWKASYGYDLWVVHNNSEMNPGYLYDDDLKVTGWFARRWMEVHKANGGVNPQAANDLMVVYQFWMARLAQQLVMPESDEWKEAVKLSINNAAKLDKGWYLERLK